MPPIVPPLAEVFATIPDFRQSRGKRHPLHAMLMLACVAMLAGARGQSGIADWAKNYGEPWRTRLGFTHAKGPSQSTVQRVFAHLAIADLEARLAQWMQQVVAALSTDALDGVAMDGKGLRMSARCGATDAHLLSLFSHRLGVVLGEVAVVDKTNEITASADALVMLLLSGVVVTGDAMFTQHAIAETILDAGNDYLLMVKENQPTLHGEISVLFADADAAVIEAAEATTHSQRIEQRRLRASTELIGYTNWPGLAQVLCMERRVTDRQTGETSEETAYAVTSLPPERATPLQLLTLWREHWHIENQLHWVRDVTFGEDASTVRIGVGPQALAAVRNLAIGLLRLGGATNIAAACRRYAAQPALALAAVGLAYRQ
ncbi:MAG: ISAs1 family transposase [Thermomicrobiales bacterium]